MTGTCYLLCFSEHYKHAKHYIGWTVDLEARLHEHRTGNGARLIQVITEAGLTFELARTWEGDRWLERRLKESYHGPPICPRCNPERANRRANWSTGKRKRRGGRKALPSTVLTSSVSLQQSSPEISWVKVSGTSDPLEQADGNLGRPDATSSDQPLEMTVPSNDPFTEERWAELVRQEPVLFLRNRVR